nr:cadherin-like domain-containing protein [Rhodospirillales bacterium]
MSNDELIVLANAPVIIDPAELLANDGAGYTLTSVQNAEHGTVSLDVDGNVVFTPDADYYGPAVFSYTVDDGTGQTSTATVTIDVKATLDESHLISASGGKLSDPDRWDAAQLQDGGHVTVWNEGAYTYLTLTNADGTTQRNRYVMPNSAGHVTEVKVEGLAGGGFVVFESSSAYSPQRTAFVVYNASGNAIGQRQLVTVESRQQGSPEIIALQDGGFVLLFKYRMTGGSSDDTFGQRYDASGDAIGERFEISGAVSGTDMMANGVELTDGR